MDMILCGQRGYILLALENHPITAAKLDHIPKTRDVS